MSDTSEHLQGKTAWQNAKRRHAASDTPQKHSFASASPYHPRAKAVKVSLPKLKCLEDRE